MADEGIRLIDRLQERGLIDRWGFTFFAGVGSIIILTAKWWNLNPLIVAVGAIALMLLYAIIVNMKGTGKLRSDQAGDNCYYLGLIYTLTSLAFAIFTFDPDNTATTIVQGFGIALASTITGLILRVFFNQSRVDLYELEETAHLELTEAAAKLKGELSMLTLNFKDFTTGLQQSITEMRDEALESIGKSAQQSVATVKELAKEVSDTLGTHAGELANSTTDLARKFSSVGRSIDRYSTSVDAMSESHEAIVGDVGRMARATEEMVKNGALVLEQTRTTREIQGQSNTLMGQLLKASNDVRASLSTTLEAARKWEGEFAARLAELESGPKDIADKTLIAIARAAEGVQSAMTELTAAHDAAMAKLTTTQDSAISSIGTSTDGLLQVVRGHNAAMEDELRKSRENAQKVHDALADMTGRLANLPIQ